MIFSPQSVSDLPVCDHAGDFLGNSRYADGLARFIESADMPITIGIQGGWGSGKTSLLNLLAAKVGNSSVIVTINAWEHSLFQERNSVAMSLLYGLISSLTQSLKQALEQSKINKATYEAALRLPGTMEKFVKTFGAVAGGLIRIGTAVATGAQIDAGLGRGDSGSNDKGTGEFASLRELRESLQHAVKTTIDDPAKQFSRVLFVIDDLDRVEPSVAVEILDVIKNVVEVPGCVFVLAIDFDVVVKGLHAKFGERSANEREFRQYFDKIIQVPFTMPHGSDRRLIEELLKRIGREGSLKHAERLSGVIDQLTDGTPRSIKRIINTTSLLMQFSDGGTANSNEWSEHSSALHAIRFVLVCIQINFPKVYEKLLRDPCFWEWRLDTKADGENQNPDDRSTDEWQDVLRLFCTGQDDSWTKTHAADLVAVLTDIRKDLDAASGAGAAEDLLEKLMRETEITSVGTTGTDQSWRAVWREFLVEFRKRGESSLFRNATGSASPWVTSGLGLRGLTIEAYATSADVRARLCFPAREKALFDSLKQYPRSPEVKETRNWTWDWVDGRATNYVSCSFPCGDVRHGGKSRDDAIAFLVDATCDLEATFKKHLSDMAERIPPSSEIAPIAGGGT